MLVTLHFWIKGGQLGPCVGHVMLLDHQVNLPLRFWIIKLGPPVSDVTFFPSPDDRTPSGEHNLYIMLMWRLFVCLSHFVIIQFFPSQMLRTPQNVPPHPPELYPSLTIQTRRAA